MENVVTKQKLGLELVHRFELLNLIPARASVTKMVVYKDIKKKIYPTQEEIKKFNVRDQVINGKDGEQCVTLFDKKSESKIDIEFTDIEILELKALLDNASKKELISEHLLNLCIELQIN